jgi:hypothetical protein
VLTKNESLVSLNPGLIAHGMSLPSSPTVMTVFPMLSKKWSTFPKSILSFQTLLGSQLSKIQLGREELKISIL